MNALNVMHVLGNDVQALGHGVQLMKQENIPSKSLVCYLDSNDDFHWGFGFRNGSNMRVIVDENGVISKKTCNAGVMVIVFDHGAATIKSRNAAFIHADFTNIAWFDNAAQGVVRRHDPHSSSPLIAAS